MGTSHRFHFDWSAVFGTVARSGPPEPGLRQQNWDRRVKTHSAESRLVGVDRAWFNFVGEFFGQSG